MLSKSGSRDSAAIAACAAIARDAVYVATILLSATPCHAAI